MDYDNDHFRNNDEDRGDAKLPTFIEYPQEKRAERRPVSSKSKKKLRKKQMRTSFIAGVITGILLSSTISFLLPDRKDVPDKEPEPVVIEPVETAVEEPVPVVVPEELMKDRNHSNAAEKYAYDIKEVKEWIKGGRSGDEKMVFLTFDDGPGSYTRDVLDVLKEKGVPATFFLLGSSAEKASKDSDLWTRFIGEGHGIALHTYSHDYDILYTDKTPNVDKFVEEWDKSVGILKERIGEDFNTRVLRFPGGSMSWKGMDDAKAKLAEKNIYDMDWNAITGDTEPKARRPATVEESWTLIQDGLSRTAHPETVVLLMHDSKEDTPKFLGEIIERFKKDGYEFGILY